MSERVSKMNRNILGAAVWASLGGVGVFAAGCGAGENLGSEPAVAASSSPAMEECESGLPDVKRDGASLFTEGDCLTAMYDFDDPNKKAPLATIPPYKRFELVCFGPDSAWVEVDQQGGTVEISLEAFNSLRAMAADGKGINECGVQASFQ